MCTVGYGDVTPRTKNEQIFTICSMFVSSWVYAVTLNDVSTMVSKYNVNAQNYREKMLYVN